MISYEPFYETLYKKNITEYHLIFKEGFSANTIYRIKKGEAMSTKTLDALCYALDCNVEDIIKFVKEWWPNMVFVGSFLFEHLFATRLIPL